MPKARARKRAAPVTLAPTPSGSTPAAPRPGAPASSPASSHTRAVIRRFHVLLKRQAQLGAAPDAAAAERGAVEREIAALGGLAAYQRMSIAGQSAPRGGGSEKVLVGWLRALGLHLRGAGAAGKAGASEGRRLR